MARRTNAPVKRLRGSATQHSSFVGGDGEITVDVSDYSLRAHDGVTPGGFPAALNSAVVHNTLDEAIDGVKTFTDPTHGVTPPDGDHTNKFATTEWVQDALTGWDKSYVMVKPGIGLTVDAADNLNVVYGRTEGTAVEGDDFQDLINETDAIENRVTILEDNVSDAQSDITFIQNYIAELPGVIAGASVAHAKQADEATHAVEADHALAADEALHALEADHAKKATEADHATLADDALHAAEADHAKEADHAATATMAAAAGTATALANARMIRTKLNSTEAAAFDGTANVEPGVSGVLGINNGGTGLTVSPSMLINLQSDKAAAAFTEAPRPGVTGVLPIANGGTGNASGVSPTAGTLETGRNLITNLGSTAAAEFDGSADVALGVSGVLPITNGGTGGSTLTQAQSNLGITALQGAVNQCLPLDGSKSMTGGINWSGSGTLQGAANNILQWAGQRVAVFNASGQLVFPNGALMWVS